MSEFRIPKRERSPGLLPSPKTEEPIYPSLSVLLVQNAAMAAERDAAIARAEKAEAERDTMAAHYSTVQRAKADAEAEVGRWRKRAVRCSGLILARFCKADECPGGFSDDNCEGCPIDEVLSDDPPEVDR